MTVTLRQESANGATTKGSALTYAELDNNFVHLLRQGSVTVRADSGTDTTLGEADKDSILNFIGTQNLTTTIGSDSAGDTQITITGPDLSSYATASSSTTFTNKTIDANGTGNSITNLEVADFAGSAVVIESEGIGSNDNDTTLPTSAAVKDYVDNNAGLTDVVSDTTPQLGGDLDVNSNSIVSVSNGNIAITPNGTGQIQASKLQYSEDVHDLGTTGGTVTPNVANGNVQTITLNNNLTINGFTSPVAGQSLTLIIDTNGTGRTLSSTMLFAGGEKTMSTTDTFDIMTVFYDGTNYFANYVTNFS